MRCCPLPPCHTLLCDSAIRFCVPGCWPARHMLVRRLDAFDRTRIRTNPYYVCPRCHCPVTVLPLSITVLTSRLPSVGSLPADVGEGDAHAGVVVEPGAVGCPHAHVVGNTGLEVERLRPQCREPRLAVRTRGQNHAPADEAEERLCRVEFPSGRVCHRVCASSSSSTRMSGPNTAPWQSPHRRSL
jgi:hypothetical protein